MKTAQEMVNAIDELVRRRAVYAIRDAKNPGLWCEEIRDCEIALARLRAGLELTRLQRGLPSL
jgi:hypothetical protein